MKSRILLAFMLLTALTGCASNAGQNYPNGQQAKYVEPIQTRAADGLQLLQVKDQVRIGENGSVTIQGHPGSVYSISSSFLSGGRMMTSYEYKTADAAGKVTWTWRVGEATTPGTYPIVITGGGASLRTSYSVLRVWR